MTNSNFQYKGREYDSWDIKRAYDLCRCLNGCSLEALAKREECSVQDIEETLESRFQSLAWNLDVDPAELFEAATEYACRK